MFCTLAFAVIVALVGSPSTHPPPPTDAPVVNLSWEAPPPCPSITELRNQVERLLGSSIDAPRTAALDALGTVVRGQQAWVLVLSLSTSSGTHQRRLEAQACPDLADAAAVMIATAIDRTTTDPPRKPEPSRELEPESPRKPEPPRKSEPPHKPEPPRLAPPTPNRASAPIPR